MKFKQIEKAAKIYEKIKSIDAEIIEIDRIAMLIANKETEVSLKLTADNLQEQVSDSEDIDLPYLTDTIGGGFIFRHYASGDAGKRCSQNKKNEASIKRKISVNASMQILGILLHEKQSQRGALIAALDEIGLVSNT